MEPKIAILHLSDLHLQSFQGADGKTIESLFNKEFQFSFKQSLKNELLSNNVSLKFIIVTGDIANKGKKDDYVLFKDFIEDLKHEFSIKESNIIITPGNHDINWSKLEVHYDNSSDKKSPYLYYKEKFEDFENFYNSLYVNTKKTFKYDKTIIDFYHDAENDIIFLSLNSSLKESYLSEDHRGFIDFTSLEYELKQLNFSNYKGSGKIALFHHNPIPYADGKEVEKGIENWNNIESLLNSYGFFVFLFGHRHKDDSKVITNKEFNYFVSVGSFAKKNVKYNTFNLLIQQAEEKFTYQLTRYLYIESDSENSVWQENTKGNYNRVLKINSSKGEEVIEEIPIDSEPLFPEIVISEQAFTNVFELTDSVRDSKEEILKFIKNNSLYKTGHFHWSEDFRTHGLIDTNYLLSNKYSQKLIKNCFIDLIKKNNIDFDLLVGIGMEGNIIGATLSNAFLQSDYTFIPDISSQKSHNEFEKRIKSGNYKKIVVIKDVVFQADAFLNLINDDKNKRIFDESVSVSLISLFFCSNKKEDLQKLNNGKIKFYYLINEINIECCPYQSKNICPIVIHKLDDYYEFYSK